MLFRGLIVLGMTAILSGVEWYAIGGTQVRQFLDSLPQDVESLIYLNAIALNLWLSNLVWRLLRTGASD
jgi:hypothetical protein